MRFAWRSTESGVFVLRDEDNEVQATVMRVENAERGRFGWAGYVAGKAIGPYVTQFDMMIGVEAAIRAQLKDATFAPVLVAPHARATRT